jgi:ATP-dependent RNA helicase DeaD
VDSQFTDLGLNPSLVTHLSGMGFKTPTQIQAATIPLLMTQETDFIGLASTGTGKTGAFAIPLVEKIDESKRYPQALILCPTRELSSQVAAQVSQIGSYKGLRVASIYGGASYHSQINALKTGAQIVVATPGRLIDLMEQGLISLKKITHLILDEADEMLSMGFQEALDEILKGIRSEDGDHRVWLFSATMNRQISNITKQYLKNPQTVKQSSGTETNQSIKQTFAMVAERDKVEVLLRLIGTQKDFFGLVFCRRREDTETVAKALMHAGIRAEAIHGEKTQRERERILAGFKARQIQALVATDVAARGIDVKELTHVVNMTLPVEVESYIHRIGRTGRNGQTGHALSLVTPTEMGLLRRIEKSTRQIIEKVAPPSADEVRNLKVQNYCARLVESMQDEKWLKRVQKNMADLVLPEEITSLTAAELFKVMLVQQDPAIVHTKDLELAPRPPRDARETGDGRRFNRPRRDFRGGERSEYRGERGGERDDRRGGRSFSRDRASDTGGDRPPRREFSRGPRPSSSDSPKAAGPRGFKSSRPSTRRFRD